jgi:lambda family phage tail tape measure protein
MAIVSRLGVVLGLDSAEFNKGLGLAESKLGGFAKSSMASSLSVVALGATLIGASVQAIQYADTINDTAKANDIAVGTVLKLSTALSINGGEADNVGKLFSSLTNKLDEAANGNDKGRASFEKLGVSVNDLRRLDETQLFEKTLQGLANITDPITRNALAMEVFGKAAKNVDIKGVADSYADNAGNFTDAEEAFKRIGDAIDKMDIMTKRASTSLAVNLEPALTASVKWLDDAIFGWDKLEKAILKAKHAKDGTGNITWKQQPLMGQEGKIGDFNLPVEYQAGGRGQELSDKDKAKVDKANEKKIADAKKLADEIKKQKEALQDQILAYDAQSYAAGRTLSEVEKITLELQQGKKYKNTSADEKEQLLNAARRVDYNNAYADSAKRASDYALQAYETEQKANEDRAKKSETMILDSEVATARLDIERQLAGSADTQMQLGLEYFDLQQKILALKKEGYSDEQLSGIANAEMNRIKAQELNERAQNTFQAGWDRAYNNFVEKSKDSAVLGAQAFESMSNSMSSALDNFVNTGKISFSDLAGSIIKDLIKIQLKAQSSSLFSGLIGSMGGIFGGGGGVGADVSFDTYNAMPRLGFANGGDPPVNQASMVGERGAELFVPRTAGTIIPNHALSALGGSNQPQTVYNGTVIQNMTAIDTQSGLQFLAKNKTAIFAANQSAQRSLPQSR